MRRIWPGGVGWHRSSRTVAWCGGSHGDGTSWEARRRHDGYRPQFYFRTTDVTGSVELRFARFLRAAGMPGSSLTHSHVRPPGGAPAGPVVQTLNDAVARVAAGGTLRVFPGTYSADRVNPTKGVTIEAVGAERPTIVGAPGASYLLNIGVPLSDDATPGAELWGPQTNFDLRCNWWGGTRLDRRP